MKQLLFLSITLLLIYSPLKAQEGVKDSTNTSKLMSIYFPWDKDALYVDYMSNRQVLKEIDSFFSNNILLSQMDSVIVTATASPEGPPVYNQKLSERRLSTIISFLLQQYSSLDQHKVRAHALGEDWEGLYLMVKAAPQTPFREEVLRLIEMPINKTEMEKRLNLIGKGVAYQYIKQHILPYLRIGGTCIIFYPKRMETLQMPVPERAQLPVIEKPVPICTFLAQKKTKEIRYIRPVALKTNLLFDVATLFNVEAEVPISKHWSIAGEWIFPWWGGLGNRGGVAPVPAYSEQFTMQMLSGNIEGRYWLPRSKALTKKAERWGDYNVLNGWFVGVYAGVGLYDFQLNGKGIQGEFFIASGVSAGYAHPVGKHLHMEYSLGIGYLKTEYYRYTAMDGHKVVNTLSNGQYERRSQVWFGPTRAKISLVWIPRFKIKK